MELNDLITKLIDEAQIKQLSTVDLVNKLQEAFLAAESLKAEVE